MSRLLKPRTTGGPVYHAWLIIINSFTTLWSRIKFSSLVPFYLKETTQRLQIWQRSVNSTMLRTPLQRFRKKCYFKPSLVKAALKYPRLTLIQRRHSHTTNHNINVGSGRDGNFHRNALQVNTDPPQEQPSQPDRKFRDSSNSRGGCRSCESRRHDIFTSLQEAQWFQQGRLQWA